jgi:CDP-2,3-bis-(O-geranylgeranyl)-sn-glycerol synthase
MHPLAVIRALVLLTVANTTPLIAKRLVGSRFSYPIDAGLRFLDGERLFGESKTIRGISLALLVTSMSAPLIGVDWKTGLLAASAAMAGDLFSSFIKRRLRLPASSRATGLDQIPESLFPLLACRKALSLTTVDIVMTVLVFVVGEVLLSRLLYKYRLRDQPY